MQRSNTPPNVVISSESQEQIQIIEQRLRGLMPSRKPDSTLINPQSNPSSMNKPNKNQSNKISQLPKNYVVDNDDVDGNADDEDSSPIEVNNIEHYLSLKNQKGQQNNDQNLKEDHEPNIPEQNFDDIDKFCLSNPQSDPNWDKPRFVIQSIHLNNFKSFNGVIQFTGMRSGYNIIVGANGSGKSNMLDGLLFAFGYNSGVMRHQKNKELITRTDTIKTLTEGYVEIVYHMTAKLNSENRFTNQNQTSKRVIKRSIKKDGSTVFEVDGQVKSAKDAKEFISGLGIDLNYNRFLVLQGQVQAISLMQPKGTKTKAGMLQYLQQIIGTKQYADRMQSLHPVIEQIKQAQNATLQQLHKVKSTLFEDQMNLNQAISYYKIIKKQMKLDSLLLQLLLHKINEETQTVAIKVMYLNNQADKYVEIMQEKERVEKMIMNQVTKNGMVSAGDENSKIPFCSVEQLEEKKVRVIEDCERYDQQIEELKQKAQMSKEEMKILRKDMHKQLLLIERVNSDEGQIKYENDCYNKFSPILQKQIDALQKKVKHIKNVLTKNGSLSKFSSDFIYNIQKANDIQTNIDKMIQDRNKVENSIEEQKVKVKETEKLMEENQADLLGLVEKKEKCDQTLKTIDNIYKSNKIGSDQLNFKYFQEKKRQLQIQRLIKTKRETISRQNMKTSFRDSFDRANIPGVFGRLGNLGSCNPEIEQVITSTCFSLNNLVVQDTAAAERAINFAISQRLGRITCIILDVIKKSHEYNMNKQFYKINNSIRLFDEVKPFSENAKLAFYYALGDFLYVRDANKLFEVSNYGGQRRKAVAKSEGKYIIREYNGVVNTSSVTKGGFGLSQPGMNFNEDEIRDLQSELVKEKSKNQVIEEEKRNMQNTLNTLSEERIFIEKQKFLAENQIKKIKDKVQNTVKVNGKRSLQAIQSFQGKINSINNKIQEAQNDKKQIEVKDKFRKLQIAKTVGVESLVLWRKMIDYEHQIKMNKKALQDYQDKRKLRQAKKGLLIKRLQPIEKRLAFIVKQFQKQQQHSDQLSKKAQLILKKKYKKLYKHHVLQALSLPRFLIKYIESQLHHLYSKSQQQDNILMNSGINFNQTIKQLMGEMERLAGEYSQGATRLEGLKKMWGKVEEELGFLERPEEWCGKEMRIEGNEEEYQIKALKILSSGQRGRRDTGFEFNHKESLQKASLDILLTVHQELVQQWGQLKKVIHLERFKEKSLQTIKTKYLSYKNKQDAIIQIAKVKNTVKEQIDHLSFTRLTKFNEGFEPLSKHLRKIFAELSVSGDIMLKYVNEASPFDLGVQLKARPPKKGWGALNKLSGGEKTLASLSLIFALQMFKPSPLYLLDEVDAALDIHYTRVISRYIKKQANFSQFIVISLRTDTFMYCDDFVGVFKGESRNGSLGAMAPLTNVQTENVNKCVSVRVVLESQNIIIYNQTDQLFIQDLCNQGVTKISEKQDDGSWKLLSMTGRKKFIWRNFLEYTYNIYDLWLNRNGWYWKRKDISIAPLSTIYRTYWIEYINSVSQRHLKKRQFKMNIEELQLKQEEKNMVQKIKRVVRKEAKKEMKKEIFVVEDESDM